MIIYIGGGFVGALVLAGSLWKLLNKQNGTFIFCQRCVGSVFDIALRHDVGQCMGH